MTSTIKLFGERNTNTNYLSRLIALNLDVDEVRGTAPPFVRSLQRLLFENELVPDLYFLFTHKRNLGWKHTRVPPPDELRQYNLVRQGTAILTVTKNPYSWLLSLFRSPHHQFGANASSFEEFVARPWKTTRRDNTARMLDNPVALWNLKNSSYLDLGELGALSTTTEQIFADAEGVVEAISEHFSIGRLPGGFRDYVQSTKDPGRDSLYYRDYYLNEKWKNEISGEAIETINAALDTSVMARFGYGLL